MLKSTDMKKQFCFSLFVIGDILDLETNSLVVSGACHKSMEEFALCIFLIKPGHLGHDLVRSMHARFVSSGPGLCISTVPAG